MATENSVEKMEEYMKVNIEKDSKKALVYLYDLMVNNSKDIENQVSSMEEEN